jgi:hypothetical protein
MKMCIVDINCLLDTEDPYSIVKVAPLSETYR